MWSKASFFILSCWITCPVRLVHFVNLLKFREGKSSPHPHPATSLPFEVKCLVWPFHRTLLYPRMFCQYCFYHFQHLTFSFFSHLSLRNITLKHREDKKTNLNKGWSCSPSVVFFPPLSVFGWKELTFIVIKLRITFWEEWRQGFLNWLFENVFHNTLSAVLLLQTFRIWQTILPMFGGYVTTLHSNLKHTKQRALWSLCKNRRKNMEKIDLAATSVTAAPTSLQDISV